MSPICPRQNESVSVICTDKLVTILIWRVTTYPDDDRPFSAVDREGKFRILGDHFTAVLVDVSNKLNSSTGEPVADLTSTLTAPTVAITNGTTITCGTLYSLQKPLHVLNSSITLILAGAFVFSAILV